MRLEEAREVLKQASLHVNFINLARTVSELGEYGFTWKTFDNSRWRPDKQQALNDSKWLAEHAEELAEALLTLKRG